MVGTIRLTKRAHISRRKFDTIFCCFSEDITAKQTAGISKVNVNTAERYFNLFRNVIIKEAIKERREAQLSNGIEIDESYFGAKRARGKRGRGAGRKIVVLGLLKRQGKVYTQIINTVEGSEILPIVKRVVSSGSDIHTDGWRSYDALAVYGYNHKKVKHEDNEFSRPEGIHINGVESFWSWSKRRLTKFNGIPKGIFGKYLLECEYRFNHRETLWKDLRRLVKKH